DGYVVASASGGMKGFTYLWNTTPVQKNDTATNLKKGTYTAVATDASGCSITGSTIVNEPSEIFVSTIVQKNANHKL
ncbi:MAG: hypothetical protein AABX16_00885, partial [Nanoarchaeota archaeon]